MRVLIKALTDYLMAQLSTNEIYSGGKVFQGTHQDHINIWLIAAPRDYDHNGPTGCIDASFQFDCKSQTLDGAYALAENVENKISGFTGMMGASKIAAIFLENENDTYYDSNGFYVVSNDYRILYEKE